MCYTRKFFFKSPLTLESNPRRTGVRHRVQIRSGGLSAGLAPRTKKYQFYFSGAMRFVSLSVFYIDDEILNFSVIELQMACRLMGHNSHGWLRASLTLFLMFLTVTNIYFPSDRNGDP